MQHLKNQYLIVFFISLIGITISCKKDDDTNGSNGLPSKEINKWINQGLDEVYLWTHELNLIGPDLENDPIKHFERSILTDDRWSWITNDYEGFVAESEGNPEAAGYKPAFGVFNGSDNMFFVILYVYPNSPADRAGLRRGDIILEINGTKLTTTNYIDLFECDNCELGFGEMVDNSIRPSNRANVKVKAEIMDNNPLLYSEIIEINNNKIGYFFYAEFISGKDNRFISDLDNLFADFKSEGITDLIVDLRYNPGGERDASGHLASLIAPKSAINSNSVLVKQEYNDLYTQYFENEYGKDSEHFKYKFPETSIDLNINKVYILTSYRSASASELLIIGLKPYMDVIVIGDTTYGKCYSSWVIPDIEEPRRHNYAMAPVVGKFANANGFTDFINGLIPDYFILEDISYLPPVGDRNDPLLSKALSVITGKQLKSKPIDRYNFYTIIESKKEKMKRTLFIN